MIYYLNQLVNYKLPEAQGTEKKVAKEIEDIREEYFADGKVGVYKVEYPEGRPEVNVTGMIEPRKLYTLFYEGGRQGEWRYTGQLPSISREGGLNFTDNYKQFYHKLELKEDDIELVWFIKNHCRDLKAGLLVEIDDEARAEKEAVKIQEDVDLRFYLYGNQSPLKGKDDMIQEIAIAFNIDGANRLGIAQVKNKLYDAIRNGNATNHKFVNTEVFMELINSREKREVAKIIFDAVASGDIAYSTKDYAWHLMEGGQFGEAIYSVAGKDAPNATQILINACIDDVNIRTAIYGFLGINEYKSADELRALNIGQLRQVCKGVCTIGRDDNKESIIEKYCKVKEITYVPL